MAEEELTGEAREFFRLVAKVLLQRFSCNRPRLHDSTCKVLQKHWNGKARITMRWMILPSTSALHGLKLQGTLTRATQNTMISAKFCCALKHQCQEVADQFHATSSASLFHLMEQLPDSNTSSVPEEPSRRLIQNPGRFLSFSHTMWNARTRRTMSLPQGVEFNLCDNLNSRPSQWPVGCTIRSNAKGPRGCCLACQHVTFLYKNSLVAVRYIVSTW